MASGSRLMMPLAIPVLSSATGGRRTHHHRLPESHAGVYANPPRLVRLPDSTRDVVIQRFGESKANLRGNAIRIITLMAGGVPAGLAAQLIQIAKTDVDGEVRGVAIGATGFHPLPAAETTEFWIQSLNNVPNKELRGKVLNSFRFYAPADPRVMDV